MPEEKLRPLFPAWQDSLPLPKEPPLPWDRPPRTGAALPPLSRGPTAGAGWRVWAEEDFVDVGAVRLGDGMKDGASESGGIDRRSMGLAGRFGDLGVGNAWSVSPPSPSRPTSRPRPRAGRDVARPASTLLPEPRDEVPLPRRGRYPSRW